MAEVSGSGEKCTFEKKFSKKMYFFDIPSAYYEWRQTPSKSFHVRDDVVSYFEDPEVVFKPIYLIFVDSRLV